MKPLFFTTFLWVVLTLTISCQADQSKRTLLSDVKIHPKWAVSSEAINPNSDFVFNVMLKQQNLDVLEKTFWEVSDPNHPNYGKFMSRQQIDKLVEPKEESFKAVTEWLEESLPLGEETKIMRGSAFISVVTKASHASDLFGTELRKWKHTSGMERVRAYGSTSYPSSLDDHVHLITGLSDFFVPHKNIQMGESKNVSGLNGKRQSGSSPYTAYDTYFTANPSNVASWYGVSSTSVTNGKTTQGVLAFDDFFQNGALSVFLSQTSISGTKNVKTGGTISSSSNFIESNLDTQYMIGLSPGANPYFIAIGKSSWLLESLEIALPLVDATPQVITISYSSPEVEVCLGQYNLCGGNAQSNSNSYLDRTDTEFQKLGVMGVTVMAASGDNGVSHWSSGFCPIDLSIYCPNGGCSFSGPSKCQQALATFSDGTIVYPTGFGSPKDYLSGWFSDNSNCNLRLDGSSQNPNSILYSDCTCDQLKYGSYGGIRVSQYVPNDPSKFFTAEWPASSPYITGIGGTQIVSGDAEVASSLLTGSRISSGGGFSQYYNRPSYQNTVLTAWNGITSGKPTSGTYNPANRGFPDISAVAHNYPVVICRSATSTSGCSTTPVDGTSASSPVFAAFITLINDALINNGKSTVGFLNPVLYDAYAKSPSAFRDITQGSNRCANLYCCTEGFEASTGWDPVTGLGVPNFEQLKSYIITAKANTVYNDALNNPYVPATRRYAASAQLSFFGGLIIALISIVLF